MSYLNLCTKDNGSRRSYYLIVIHDIGDDDDFKIKVININQSTFFNHL